ncbi:DUF1275 domain protein [Oopsacas minuta]|uniref:DUF1275 domain protein n=1 Tax=Oopsacas minuta TaxID=111878 RepID=A0AAV7JIC1_9METZ|nr:DUF1275 domain protein [Oopsacas minuta]
MATVHKTQLSLKRKVTIAQDLSKGMTQLDAVQKYKASKGTVSRISKEKERWVAINFETLDSALRKGTERKRIVSRNRIVSSALQGGRGSAPMNAVEEFKKILPTLLKGYDKKDVLNGDEEWLLYLNTTIETQKRNVLLFLDNFSGHECGFELAKEHLTHVLGEWLPANCTSLLQPVDQGIGNALKIRYFKYLHEHMSKMIFIDKHPMEGVDMFRAYVWLGRVWNSLHNTSTVSRYFEKAGFRFESHNEIIPDLISDVVNHDEQDILDQEVLIAGPPAVVLRLSELEKYFEHKGMDDEVTMVIPVQDKILERVQANLIQPSIDFYLLKKNNEN